MPIEVVRAFAILKKAAAFTNRDLGVLAPEKADLIAKVCDEILAGKLDDEFPLVKDCGIWGDHYSVQMGNMDPDHGRVTGCNTDAIRDLCRGAGMSCDVEAGITLQHRVAPVSEGFLT